MNPILDNLQALDDELADRASPFPRLSAWWRSTLTDFYTSGRRQLVLRVGRRGGKSSSLCRVAVCEALYGEHVVQPGDVGIIGIVSVSRDEANQRLRTIKAVLGALGVTHHPIENGIELDSRPVAFKVFAASVSGVVGGSWIAAICDEVAAWRDSDTGQNPATQVLASLRPCLATMPNARIFLSSSARGRLDAHAAAFDLGDTDFQRVAFAETWIANPTLTIADTHALETEERVWKREYAGIPQGDSTTVFDLAAIDRAMLARPVGMTLDDLAEEVIAVDWSRGSHTGDERILLTARWLTECTEAQTSEELGPCPCGSTWPMVAGQHGVQWVPNYATGEGEYRKQCQRGTWHVIDLSMFRAATRRVLEVTDILAAPGTEEEGLAALAKLARSSRATGPRRPPITRVFHDNWEASALAALWKRAIPGIRPTEETWTNASKSAAVARVSRLLDNGQLRLPHHPTLRKQMAEYRERFTKTGALTYDGKGRDDWCQAVVTLGMTSVSGALPGDPFGIDRRRHEIDPTQRPTKEAA